MLTLRHSTSCGLVRAIHYYTFGPIILTIGTIQVVVTGVASLYDYKACVHFSQERHTVEPSVFMKQPTSKAGTIDSIL